VNKNIPPPKGRLIETPLPNGDYSGYIKTNYIQFKINDEPFIIDKPDYIGNISDMLCFVTIDDSGLSVNLCQ